MLPNYYDILGLLSTATDKEILKAFRQRAKLYHPDLNKSFDAHQRFIEVSEAYEVLRDRTKRQLYDSIFIKQSTTDFRQNGATETGEQTIYAAAETGRKKGEQYAANYNYFSKKVLKNAFGLILTELVLSLLFGSVDGGGFAGGIALLVGGIVVFFVNYDTDFELGVTTGLFLTFIGTVFIIRSWRELTRKLEE